MSSCESGRSASGSLVDSGSRLTIISRSMLHVVTRQLIEIGLPTLELSTARLFEKDGHGSGYELVITAQLKVKLEADGESVNVIVFVQPDSEQQYLLEMNAIPALGLSVSRANREPLILKKG